MKLIFEKKILLFMVFILVLLCGVRSNYHEKFDLEGQDVKINNFS